jgi:hypothetical protein
LSARSVGLHSLLQFLSPSSPSHLGPGSASSWLPLMHKAQSQCVSAVVFFALLMFFGPGCWFCSSSIFVAGWCGCLREYSSVPSDLSCPRFLLASFLRAGGSVCFLRTLSPAPGAQGSLPLSFDSSPSSVPPVAASWSYLASHTCDFSKVICCRR